MKYLKVNTTSIVSYIRGEGQIKILDCNAHVVVGNFDWSLLTSWLHNVTIQEAGIQRESRVRSSRVLLGLSFRERHAPGKHAIWHQKKGETKARKTYITWTIDPLKKVRMSCSQIIMVEMMKKIYEIS